MITFLLYSQTAEQVPLETDGNEFAYEQKVALDRQLKVPHLGTAITTATGATFVGDEGNFAGTQARAGHGICTRSAAVAGAGKEAHSM